MEEYILCLCGSFSPPTTGHIGMLTVARNYYTSIGKTVKKCLVIPTNDAYGKKSLVPARTRIEMCELAVQGTGFIECETYEAELDHWVTTVTTFRHLKEKYPGCRPILICGEDLLLNFYDKWDPDSIKELLTDCGICIFERKMPVEIDESRIPYFTEIRDNIVYIDDNPFDKLSSTVVRGLCAKHMEITGFVPTALAGYIKRNKLYE